MWLILLGSILGGVVNLVPRVKAFIAKVRSKFKFRTIKYKILESPRSKGYLNIIYILPTGKNNKSGGDKVIYKQSEVINNLNQIGVKSSVLHVENTSTRLDWFDHQVNFKKDYNFDPNSDFVVIPEIMLLQQAKLFSDIGVSYAIFVQGGYLIDAYSQRYDDLVLAYKNASLILAISEDAVKCIETAYPWAADKIIRIFYSIDAIKFKSSKNKENLITYMPRRLSRHANLIKFFLNEKLPKDWKFKEIHRLDEAGVISLLSKSKIFLSLSELEGCPLPPAEAALSGNYVIGYTGEGGKEYWKAPIFTEVYCGDIKKFVNEILVKIKQLDTTGFGVDFNASRTELANRYSESAEKQSLVNFLHKAENILNLKKNAET